MLITVLHTFLVLQVYIHRGEWLDKAQLAKLQPAGGDRVEGQLLLPFQIHNHYDMN